MSRFQSERAFQTLQFALEVAGESHLYCENVGKEKLKCHSLR